MRKLTLHHVAAISRAEGYMQKEIIPDMLPNHQKCIEDDFVRLHELKKWILIAMYQPGLPITADIPEVPEADGDSS